MSSNNTELIESWPFVFGRRSFERLETLEELAIEVVSAARGWAGDQDHDQKPDKARFAREINTEGFEQPVAYDADGPKVCLTESDLAAVTLRAEEIYERDRLPFRR